MSTPTAASTDRLISARNIACDTEGCEDRAVWRAIEGAFCDGCHTFLRSIEPDTFNVSHKLDDQEAEAALEQFRPMP